MPTASARRALLAASCASLALLAAACGPSGGGAAQQDAKPSAAAPSPSPTPEVKALAAAELEKLTLADGDVRDVKIRKAGADDVATAAEVTTDKPQCMPLAQAGGLAPTGKAVTTTERIGIGKPSDPADPMSIAATSVQLASYDGKGAEEALASLKAAGQACGGGFVTTAKGEKTTVKSVTPSAVTAGDEAAAWAITSEDEGEVLRSQMVAFRKGNNLVVVHAVRFDAKPATAQPFVDAQLKKLG
ncbi:sensor domain-containing protein [Streptomyces sp. NRRL F-2664]|uniref:sensor domain-containing protein n=1 Tax=Streptomyces sp. NRRL F-2664 TaxID=1463842 RepID=UPI0006918580|nr:sensor domain-containing protein [Streptomyces sp. NRRL F-2664]